MHFPAPDCQVCGVFFTNRVLLSFGKKNTLPCSLTGNKSLTDFTCKGA